MVCLFQAGCATPAQTAGAIGGGIIGAMIVGGRSPAQELEQIYYLGVFDPRGQLPPQVYRLTVRGQASAISGVKFASGWVPAPLIDSLAGHLEMNVNTNGSGLTISKDDTQLSAIEAGRRLVLFGPEGFREAPKDHRLVIVMGASPKAFFEAIDQALGSLSAAQSDRGNLLLERDILRTLKEMDTEKAKWQELTASNPELFKNP